ncbi:MAG: hypothetical protein WAQ28_11930 [Bacteroidia bacterium]
MENVGYKTNRIKRFLHRIPVRLIISVVAGLVTSFALSTLTHEVLHLLGIFPKPFKPIFDRQVLIISLFYHCIFAITGAFVTARVAQEKANKAVFILGSKEAIMWLIGTILLWHHAPPWFNVAKATLGIPLAWIGGRLYKWYKANQKPLPTL